jgi:hypothetical protein
MRLILVAAAIAFPAVTALTLIVNHRFEALAQDMPVIGVFVDHDTGCEYLRGERRNMGATRSDIATSLTPRMEGRGLDYRHRGCRL